MDWYYAENNQQKGPVTDEGLEALVASGVVTPATLVWYAGMPEWKPYSAVKGTAPPSMAVPAERAFCSQCGKQFASHELVNVSGALVCGTCKPTFVQQLREGTVVAGGRRYAGFWLRFAAILIDGIILNIAIAPIRILLVGSFMGSMTDPWEAYRGVGLLAQFLGLVLMLAYESWFLVNKGATLGKMACGLQVIRASGGEITWGLAIGRFFARLVSYFTCFIGFVIAGFDNEKRTLHDRMCDTRVIRK